MHHLGGGCLVDWLVGWLVGCLVGWVVQQKLHFLLEVQRTKQKLTSRIAGPLGLIHALLPIGKPFGRLGLPAVSGLQSWKLEDTFSGGGGKVKLHIGE